MIHVAYDITSYAVAPHGGIARVCYHTITQADRSPGIQATGYYRSGNISGLKLEKTLLRRSGPLTRLIGPRFDIAHSLCHRTLGAKAHKNVYMVHDVWSLSPNSYQSAAFQQKVGARQRDDILKADFVITISETTRKNLLALNLIDPSKCRAVHLGYAHDSSPAQSPQNPAIAPLLAKKYVLYVGCLENRKNLPHVIDAVLPLKSVDLVLAGQPGFGYKDKIQPSLAKFPSDRLHHLDIVETNDLNLLYQNAIATILPSWEEGFGLPILEAMANRCPVITSNRSANAEIAGDGAILVDPGSPDESRKAIERLIQDADYRASTIDAGMARSKSFTWEKYYARLVEIYKALMSS
ncbi:MAG: glycosyltransferase family 1 protein [Candidatus Zixiibacteriota bacterium]